MSNKEHRRADMPSDQDVGALIDLLMDPTVGWWDAT